MSIAQHSSTGRQLFGNFRKPRTSGFGQFGRLPTLGALAATILGVIMMSAHGVLVGIAVMVVSGIVFVGIAVQDAGGQSSASRIAMRVGFRTSQKRGETGYQSGPTTALGDFKLPGLLAQTRLIEITDALGNDIGVVHFPEVGHWSVSIACQADGAGLKDGADIDQEVAAWGENFLRPLGSQPHLVQSAVTVQTAPDLGPMQRRELATTTRQDAPDFARQVMGALADTQPVGAASVNTWITLTFRQPAPVRGQKPDLDAIPNMLAEAMPDIVRRLNGTGAGVPSPMSGQELCDAVAIAYDPDQAVARDDLAARGQRPMLRRWTSVGPSATRVEWDHFRHDSGCSASYIMTVAPTGLNQASMLTRVLSGDPAIPVKRVTILFDHVTPDVAPGIVDSDINHAERRHFQRTRKGTPSARTAREVAAAVQNAEEEASGAGIVAFALVATVTAGDPPALLRAQKAFLESVPGARIRMRPVYGAQSAAFTYTLPLGVCPRSFSVVPEYVREGM